MTPYYTKVRIVEEKPVRLYAFENGRTTHIIMAFPSGYLQTITYSDFLNRLSTARSLSDNPVLDNIKEELDEAITHPIESINQPNHA